MLADFDPGEDAAIVRLEGVFETILLPGSFVWKGRNLDKLEFKAPHGTPGIRNLQIRDDGRFKVQVKDVDLGDIDLDVPVTFSLVMGDRLFHQQVQLDEKGKFRVGFKVPWALGDLIDDVMDLAPEPLTKRQADKLVKKLEHGLREMRKGKTQGAVKQLKGFLKDVMKLERHVSGFDGTAIKEDAQDLIDMIRS